MIITFNSSQSNVGSSTLSIALSNILAQNGHSVLYIDGEYHYPKFTINTDIEEENKNILNFLNSTDFDLTDNISKVTGKSNLSENLEYLAFPSNYSYIDDYPEFSDVNGIATNFEKILKLLDFDFIVINTGFDLNSMLKIPSLQVSDVLINVLPSDPANIIYFRNEMEMLQSLQVQLPKQQIQMLNFVPQKNNSIKNTIESILSKEIDYLIYYDSKRVEYLEEGMIGSPVINNVISTLCSDLNFIKNSETKKFGIFK